MAVERMSKGNIHSDCENYMDLPGPTQEAA